LKFEKETKVSAHARGTNGGHDGDDVETSPGTREAPLAARGFSAQLRGVSLWDLVQMECLARSRLAVQVVGEGGVGYLYFDRGQIIFATTAQRVGEAAALEILGWTNGSFQPCERPWPEKGAITTSHEGLILQVAQLRDEGRTSNLVAFPGRVAQSEAASSPAFDEAFEEIELTEMKEEGEGEMRSSNMDEVLPPPKNSRGDARGELGGDYEVVLRLGSNGAIISNRGGSEELAETVSYAQRMVQLAGELLGLEPFSALECTFADGRCIVFPEGEGETVALRPRPEANLQALRQRLGL
jgi:hypothetical protein